MVDGMREQRPCRRPAILLGHVAARAAAAPRRDHQCHRPAPCARALAEPNLARQRIPPYLAPSHEPPEAHPDRPGPHRNAGHPGADDGRHRHAVPADRQALRRRADGHRDDRQPGGDPRDPPVAAEGGLGSDRGAGVDAARRLLARARWPRRRSSTRIAARRSSTSTWAARSRRWSTARPARR